MPVGIRSRAPLCLFGIRVACAAEALKGIRRAYFGAVLCKKKVRFCKLSLKKAKNGFDDWAMCDWWARSGWHGMCM